MKRLFLFAVLVSGLVAQTASAGTAPIYVNTAPVIAPPQVAPQIDASIFINQSLFAVDNDNFSFNPLPYETLNTKFFTNRASGNMVGQPGFRFDFSTNNFRLPMDTWVNNGSISVDADQFFFIVNTLTTTAQGGNWLMVSATNIISTGPLRAGEVGLIQLEGKNIDLRRNGIRTGAPLTNQTFFGGGFLGSSNYFNDLGVTDIYWGEGTNNTLDNSGMPMRLDFANFTLPFPQSPLHQVIDSTFFSGFLFTNLVSVPSFFSFANFGTYGAFVYTNQLNATSSVVQVVFAPTNNIDTNFITEVRFAPNFFSGGATVVVGFHSVDFDIVAQTKTTNSVYLLDDLALQTNVFLARNFAGPRTRRPSTYEVTRGRPFEAFRSVTNNAVFTPELIYNPLTYLSNTVPILYAGYAAQLSSSTFDPFIVGGALADPTNFPGRIEIIGDKVNLDKTRIRAETTLILKAKDLTSNRLAQIDAPFVNLDLGSTQPELVISNVAPQGVRRLQGQIAAWSGSWRNVEVVGNATNTLFFHVLIVDPSLQGIQPVLVNEFAIRGNNLQVADSLNIGRKLLVDAVGLHVTGGLGFPFGSSLGTTNFQRVLNFTNDGIFNVPGAAAYGTDRPAPYHNFINRGTNVAAAQAVRATNFFNSGTFTASGGSLMIDALTARFSGPPTLMVTNIFTNFFFDIFGNFGTNLTTNITVIGAVVQSDSDIDIRAATMTASNSSFRAGIQSVGSLLLNVTNQLTDSGPSAVNDWIVTSGFQTLRKPAVSDLLGTHITSRLALFLEALHVWAGEDRGAVNEGFTNNLALGKLVLDGQDFSLFRFQGLGTSNALYVDLIEFLNTTTNFDNPTFLEIAPDFTIYFAAANIPAEKLDGAMNGRFRWVPTFAGPNSSTNIVYPSGQTYVFNIALASSKDIDSDADGISNADDPTPFFVAESIELGLTLTNIANPQALVEWIALARSTNQLEYRTFDTAPWLSLTSFVQGDVTTRVRVVDPIIGLGSRMYRVRVDPGP